MYTKPLFDALIVFLKKWEYIKNAIPIRNDGIRRGYCNRVQPVKGH
jgi:hypothetical protein